MTQFLNVDFKTLVNVDTIERVFVVGKKTWVALRGEDRLEVDGDIDKIRKSLLPVVAATPGHFVVRCGEDDDGAPWTHRSPVVAGRIDDDRAIPVTPDDNDGNDADGATLAPDGSVTMPYDRTFETEAEWRDEMLVRSREEKQRKLKVVE